MIFSVPVFIQECRHGFFSLQVLTDQPVTLFCQELEQGLEELQLYLSDQFERLHPGQLSRYATPEDQRLEVLPLSQALPVEEELGQVERSTQISVVVARDRQHQRLFFPRWHSHLWIARDGDLQQEVQRFVGDHHLKKMKVGEKLTLRFMQREWLQHLEIDAEPAPLQLFTGKFYGDDLLPPPTDPEREAAGKKKKKKKKPPTPTLKKIGLHLSQMAKDSELERAFGRATEVEALKRIIDAGQGAAIAVLGESGVGKTTLLNELVYRLQAERAVWYVDASRLVAGEGWFGAWQEQCLDVVQECIDAGVVWYVGNLLELLDAGKSINSDQNVSFLLRSHIASKKLTIIGECNPKAWTQLELRDRGFARLFTPFRLEEPKTEVSQDILRRVAQNLERDNQISIDDDGLSAIVEVGRRYGQASSLLGYVLHFLRRLYEHASVENQRSLGRRDVLQQCCRETGLPEFMVRDDLHLDTQQVESALRQRLIGQDPAVAKMVDLVATIKAGLSDLERPLGSYLFVGPTGVGKTEMAKALAQFLFGQQERLIRFDMSEFVTSGSVHRFLGSAQQEGKLVAAIRKTPFAVLLLDEIEKAHPAIFDVLLQVLGEGRLSDEAGRPAHFRNVVVVMTSNLGAVSFRSGIGFGDTSRDMEQHFRKTAQQFFRPEFFNRIDAIVPFHPLGAQAISRIAGRELAKLQRREGFTQRQLDLHLPETVGDWLAQQGVDERYGARPLKRVIEQQLNAPLARHLSQTTAQQTLRIEVDLNPDENALSLRNSGQSPQQKSTKTAVALKRLIDNISTARFRCQRWQQTTGYRELLQEVKLADRLSQDRHFWLDRSAAEQRLAQAAMGREITEAMVQTSAQIEALEDLLYELYFDRAEEIGDELSDELKRVEESLSQVELRLFAQRFETPDHSTLYLLEHRNSGRWLKQLLTTYAELAQENRWRLTLFAADKLQGQMLAQQGVDPDALGQQLAALDKRSGNRASRKTQGPQDRPKTPKLTRVQAQERLSWVWEKLGSLDLNDDQGAANFARLHGYTATERFANAPKALVFGGSNCACSLFAEGGEHSQIKLSGSQQVRVLFVNQKMTQQAKRAHSADLFLQFPQQNLVAKTDLLHPQDLAWSKQKRRLLHDGKRLAQDLELGIHYQLTPRLGELYRRFMRASLYREVFGQKALTWFGKGSS